jgi:hypothetical protein
MPEDMRIMYIMLNRISIKKGHPKLRCPNTLFEPSYYSSTIFASGADRVTLPMPLSRPDSDE